MAYVSQESICKTLLTDANKLIKKGDYIGAEQLLREAVQRVENATGPRHPRIAAVLLRLGDFYKAQNKFDEAEEQFRRAMSIYEDTFGLDNLDVAICLQYLADSLDGQGRSPEAKAIRARGQGILAQRLSNFGLQSVSRGN